MTFAGRDETPDGTTVAWRELLVETVERLRAAEVDDPNREARWLVEEAAGFEPAELLTGLDEPATVGGVRRLDAMLARRARGEPLQYVLGHWPFRHLDLLVDRRVLIPRPETEQVVEVALGLLADARVGHAAGPTVTVVDLGTGSGAIGLSIAVEMAAADVWCVERSPEALAVARANLAGIGRAGARVTLVEGSWFEPLPAALRGACDLVIANPPYVPVDDELPTAVADWEPVDALRSGPDGCRDLDHIVDGAPAWLAPGGGLVIELGPDQAPRIAARAAAIGFVDVAVHPDLAGLDRCVTGRWPGRIR